MDENLAQALTFIGGNIFDVNWDYPICELSTQLWICFDLSLHWIQSRKLIHNLNWHNTSLTVQSETASSHTEFRHIVPSSSYIPPYRTIVSHSPTTTASKRCLNWLLWKLSSLHFMLRIKKLHICNTSNKNVNILRLFEVPLRWNMQFIFICVDLFTHCTLVCLAMYSSTESAIQLTHWGTSSHIKSESCCMPAVLLTVTHTCVCYEHHWCKKAMCLHNRSEWKPFLRRSSAQCSNTHPAARQSSSPTSQAITCRFVYVTAQMNQINNNITVQFFLQP